MSRRGEQARAVEKRAAILNAAIKLLLDEGLRGVTHRQVAASAGVPVGSIGYYYSTREKLVVTCLEKLFDERRHAFKHAMGDDVDLTDPVQFAESVVDIIGCGCVKRTRNVVYAFVESEREDGEIREYSEQVLVELHKMITEMMRVAGIEGLSASRVAQIAIGSAVTEPHRDAPVAAVTDLLRLAGA